MKKIVFTVSAVNEAELSEKISYLIKALKENYCAYFIVNKYKTYDDRDLSLYTVVVERKDLNE